jgi:hypothetical protein
MEASIFLCPPEFFMYLYPQWYWYMKYLSVPDNYHLKGRDQICLVNYYILQHLGQYFAVFQLYNKYCLDGLKECGWMDEWMSGWGVDGVIFNWIKWQTNTLRANLSKSFWNFPIWTWFQEFCTKFTHRLIYSFIFKTWCINHILNSLGLDSLESYSETEHYIQKVYHRV